MNASTPSKSTPTILQRLRTQQSVGGVFRPGVLETPTWELVWSEHTLDVRNRDSGASQTITYDDSGLTVQVTRAVHESEEGWVGGLLRRGLTPEHWLNIELRGAAIGRVRLQCRATSELLVGLPMLEMVGEPVALDKAMAMLEVVAGLGARLAIPVTSPSATPSTSQARIRSQTVPRERLELALAELERVRQAAKYDQKQLKRQHDQILALTADKHQVLEDLGSAHSAYAQQVSVHQAQHAAEQARLRELCDTQNDANAQLRKEVIRLREAHDDLLAHLSDLYQPKEGFVKTLTEHNLALSPRVSGDPSQRRVAGVFCPMCHQRGEQVEMYFRPMQLVTVRVKDTATASNYHNVFCPRCGHSGVMHKARKNR